jgi:hypothetical protein
MLTAAAALIRWNPITVVTLNPERESVVDATLGVHTGGRKRVG